MKVTVCGGTKEDHARGDFPNWEVIDVENEREFIRGLLALGILEKV